MTKESELREKFKKVMQISNRISKADAAEMMEITQKELLKYLFKWGDDLSFKIEEEIIVVDDISNFTDGIDAMFEDWNNKEATRFGKIGDITINELYIPEQQPDPFKCIQPKKKEESNIGEYNGVKLLMPQIKFLREIETLIGEKKIPRIDEIKWDSFGFKTKGKSIIGLGLYKKGLTTLPESIEQLKNLQELHLWKNKLTSLPESIGCLENLQYLYLVSNQFSILSKAIGKMQNLQTLWLNGNQLTNLPEVITRMAWLKSLYIGGNGISKLPESIGHLNNLQELSLSYNKLTSLPESIGQLENLKELNLRDNQLANLPESIISLKSLKELWMRKNKITNLSDSLELWIKNLKQNGCDVER